MTEDEAREAIFKLNNEYMMHSREERLELYDEYKRKRAEIRQLLSDGIMKNKEKQFKKE